METKNFLNNNFFARWGALLLVASMMFFTYMFVDVMSPLKSLLESSRSWDSTAFGIYGSSEFFLNVFCFFLIFAGVILDKMGVRFTGLLSGGLMLTGAVIKYIGISDWFQVTSFHNWLNSWWPALPGSAKMACLGFMIFGCGCEMADTTVSKAIAKWFKGKEMALAMSLEMAIARLGVFAVMWLSPLISAKFNNSIVAPVAFCTALLFIGLLCFIVFALMDKNLDQQLLADGSLQKDLSAEKDEEAFNFRDLKNVFANKMFWYISILCVLYYSAIFPFQRFAPNILEETLGIDAASASRLFSCFPILAMVLTPFLGALLDFKGKGASMLMLGAAIMIVCHLSFAFLLPQYPNKWLALLLIVTLGVSFSLVPASLWPSVPKIIDEKILGSAYCLIFWVQNVGLFLVPIIIGAVRKVSGSYVAPMIIFASFGLFAFYFAFMLKIEDKKKGYGLELPNVRKKNSED